MICNWQQVCNRIGCKNSFSPEFLKSKDGQRSVKKIHHQIMGQFQNNVPHCKIVKTFNISSSTWKIIKRENLEKSLCTGDKIQNHVCDLWTLSWKSLHGLRNTFGNCCLWINMCHPQMQVKAPSRKKKSCVNSESLLWAKVHLKWIEAKWETVLWSGLLSALNSKACIRDGLRGH